MRQILFCITLHKGGGLERDAKGKKEVSTWFLNFKTVLKHMGIIGGKDFEY